MGRSAKLMKRPTQKEKSVSKMAKAAAVPIKAAPVEEPRAAAVTKSKKRKLMRAKAEKKEKTK